MCEIADGIHRDYKDVFVKETLEAFVNFEIKVRQFQKTLKENEKVLHWWIVNTETREQALELKQIRSFEGAIIHWEPLKNSGAIRCFNCQSFNHMASGCMSKSKCGRCAGPHGTKSCSLDFVERNHRDYLKTKCANCDREGHPAYDPECPTALREAEKKRRREEEAKNGNNRPRVPTAGDFDVPRKQQRGAPAPVQPTNNIGSGWVNNNTAQRNAWDYIDSQSRDNYLIYVQSMKRLWVKLLTWEKGNRHILRL